MIYPRERYHRLHFNFFYCRGGVTLLENQYSVTICVSNRGRNLFKLVVFRTPYHLADIALKKHSRSEMIMVIYLRSRKRNTIS